MLSEKDDDEKHPQDDPFADFDHASDVPKPLVVPILAPSPLRPRQKLYLDDDLTLHPPVERLPQNSPPPRSYRTLSGMLRISSATMKHNTEGQVLCPHGKPLKSVDVFTGQKVRKEWWFPQGEAIGRSDICSRCAIGLAREQVSEKFRSCTSSPDNPPPGTIRPQHSGLTPPPRPRPDPATVSDDRKRLVEPTSGPEALKLIELDVCNHRKALVPAGMDLEMVKIEFGTCWKCRSVSLGHSLAMWSPFWCLSTRKQPVEVISMPAGVRREID